MWKVGLNGLKIETVNIEFLMAVDASAVLNLG